MTDKQMAAFQTVITVWATAWAMKHWPEAIYPHSYEKARVMFYKNRASLVKAGVVSRIGRDVVFDGERFRKWLQAHTQGVESWKNAGLERYRQAVRAEST